MDRDGYLYTVNEDGGGDASHPQLWVYAPPSVQPGVPRMTVSEVAPWGSGTAGYGADWFELTNDGPTAVDLTGWKMDDSSNSFASAVPLAGVPLLPAGESAVFFEDTGGLDDATVAAAFSRAWFGSAPLPAGFLIGHYGGSGVGLSTGGDAVNLFDGTGNPVTGVAVGASPTSSPFATFDNTAGLGSATLPLPVVSTLSVVGIDGAFLGADGTGIGSPGGFPAPDLTPPYVVASAIPTANANGWNNTSVTVSYACVDAGSGVDPSASDLADDVLTASGTATGTCVDKAGNSATASYSAQIDKVTPAVAYSGNTGSYGILTDVAITCAATDGLSGLDGATCADATGPAWSFGAGAHTLSARATDKAGNVGSGSTTFTVTVRAADLATLTTQFVRGSDRYQSAGPVTRLIVSAIVAIATGAILQAAQAANPAVKAALLALYGQTVQVLTAGQWLTGGQAATLTGLAAAI